ncbi:adenosylcobinamide-GDP ribazoletransferase [Streptomyces sp. ST2-7A]|uniref:adenosylcobinamide-GDP ribazoletransferase n=1 Tax=Streptomyces sp. ST2-7A TaxID=2907214 RepID=UPI001F245AB3|nr:adenosylcobinamide-GDP ribazoletransferase [Streptomyces sp. ST2-7A]MCE7081540.1 adenosylcobinamide-GDP ribazoletransferase [Streptomyces sp. ST2-7A]
MDATPQPPPDHPPAGEPDAGAGSPGRPGPTDGPRFALGTLTILPVRVRRWDRAAARAGMGWAPLAGLVVGVAAGTAGAGAVAAGTGTLLGAVAAVAVPAVLTRGLHLDGLADVADGLGSGKPADEALRIMKRSDIGPFGVVTLVLVLLGQVAAAQALFAHGWAMGATAVCLAHVTGRTALTLAARRGVPAARPGGLGAMVAGTVPRTGAMLRTGAVTLLGAGAGAVAGAAGPPGVPAGGVGGAVLGGVAGAAVVICGTVVSEAVLRRCRRRLGGVTGDVFGALAESATTTALVVAAVAAGIAAG